MKTTNEQEKIFRSIKTGIKNARYGEINLNEIDIEAMAWKNYFLQYLIS